MAVVAIGAGIAGAVIMAPTFVAALRVHAGIGAILPVLTFGKGVRFISGK